MIWKFIFYIHQPQHLQLLDMSRLDQDYFTLKIVLRCTSELSIVHSTDVSSTFICYNIVDSSEHFTLNLVAPTPLPMYVLSYWLKFVNIKKRLCFKSRHFILSSYSLSSTLSLTLIPDVDEDLHKLNLLI